MKNKRIERKGSHTNANNGGDAVKVKVTPTNDTHHNIAIPNCNLVASIAQEIFPTGAASPDDAGASVVNKAASGLKDNSANGGNDGDKQEGNSTAGKKSKDGKTSISEDGSSTTRGEEQPLLGYMIQRHLVEERKRTRAEHAGTSGPIEVAASKKKKSKKKKKKKGVIPTAAVANGTCRVGDENDDSEGGDGGDNDCQAPPTTDIKENAEISTELVATRSHVTSCSRQSLDSDGHSLAGGTKTYLDGLLDSLIDSAQPSCINGMENRNIEAFSAYLKRKFDSHSEQRMRQQTQQNRDRAKGDASSAWGSHASSKMGGMEYKDILPTISINDVQDLSNSIDCRTCRTTAISSFRSLIKGENFSEALRGNFEGENKKEEISSTPLNPGSPQGLSIPISGSANDDVAHAFSYVNMEELDLEAGRLDVNTKPVPFHLQLRPIAPAGENDRFAQIRPVLREGGDNGGSGLEYPMSAQDIIHLVKQIILPCGLAPMLPRPAVQQGRSPAPSRSPARVEDGLADTSSKGESTSSGDELGNNELTAIAKEALGSLAEIRDWLTVFETSLSSVKVEMDKVENYDNRSIFDVRTSTILQDCDEKIESLLKQFGSLMLQLFKLTCFVGWSLKRGSVSIELFRRIWLRYTTALERLVAPTVDHHANVLQSSSGGAIKQAYQNKMVRDSLHRLMRGKMSTLQELVIDLKSILERGGDTVSSALELCVLHAYRHHIEGPGVTFETIFPDQESEDLLKQLITAQTNLSQRTLNSPSPEDLKNKAKDQRDRIFSLCRKVRKNVIAMEDFALESKHDFLRSNHRMLETFYYDYEKYRNKNHHLGGELMSSWSIDDGNIVRDLSSLLQLSMQLVLQWLSVLCSRQSKESLVEPLDLPPRLKTWSDKVVRLTFKPFSELEKTIDLEFPTSIPSNVKKNNTCEEGLKKNNGMRRISSIVAGLLYRWLEARCSEWHAEVTSDELLQSVEEKILMVVAEGSVKGSKKKKSNRKSGGGDKGKNKDEQASTVTSRNNTTTNNTMVALSSFTNPSTDSIPINYALEDDQLTRHNIISNNWDINAAEMYLIKRLEMVIALNEMDSSTATKKIPLVWL
ncbi:hypothetical protein ACHAW5_011212 [Stephanodiscus triporus]|uniref:Uncharacterized protein n=1 Tax=Stephanodiscus triporus TaxID=2934178 RepID=A0ABD3QV07_9STRA